MINIIEPHCHTPGPGFMLVCCTNKGSWSLQQNTVRMMVQCSVQVYTHNTPVMCNIGQYPLFCGHWARQLALKYINCGQSPLYKNYLTEKVEHYIWTGWCWYDSVTQCDTAQTQTQPQHSVKYLSDCEECGLWCWWWWSVLVKCDNNVVDLSTSDIADTLLLPSFILAGRWSPLQSNLEIQMLEASPVLCHQHIVDIPGQSDRPTLCTVPVTGGWPKSIFYCFPVITRKLMFSTGCALTSDQSLVKL